MLPERAPAGRAQPPTAPSSSTESSTRTWPPSAPSSRESAQLYSRAARSCWRPRSSGAGATARRSSSRRSARTRRSSPTRSATTRSTTPATPTACSCPVGAHVRRANPRDSLPFEGKLVNRHRLIRRGIPYGDPLPPGRRTTTAGSRGDLHVSAGEHRAAVRVHPVAVAATAATRSRSARIRT